MAKPLFTPEERRRLERLRLAPFRPRAYRPEGEWRGRRFGRSGLFVDHRPYAPGDDLRSVDWNVYARLGDLVVKRYESEDSLDLLLLVDRSLSMEGDKSRLARRLAAALGLLALGRRDRVHVGWLPSLGGEALQRLEGPAGPATLLETFTTAGVSGQTDHRRDIGRLRPHFPRRALALVCSDFFDAGEVSPALRLLAGASLEIVAVHVVDVRDAELPEGDAIRAVDVESGVTLRVDVTPAVQDALRRSWQRRVESLRALCARRGIQVLRADVRAPFWSLLRRLMTLTLAVRVR